MTAPAKTTATKSPEHTAPNTWRQVQEAQKKVDRTRGELNAAIERYGAAEAELVLASDRLDRALEREPAPAVLKP